MKIFTQKTLKAAKSGNGFCIIVYGRMVSIFMCYLSSLSATFSRPTHVCTILYHNDNYCINNSLPQQWQFVDGKPCHGCIMFIRTVQPQSKIRNYHFRTICYLYSSFVNLPYKPKSIYSTLRLGRG